MSRQRTMIRASVALAATAGLLILTQGTALAQGPPIVQQTDHLVNQVEISIDVQPCTGQPAELTVTESGRIHFTLFADGTVHFTGTLHGTLSADALPADGIPDATGTFTTHFGGNGLLLEQGGAIGKGEGGSTVNLRGTNADGSAFRSHAQEHTVFDSAGVPKLDFSKARCN
jgi:hypothetical protein